MTTENRDSADTAAHNPVDRWASRTGTVTAAVIAGPVVVAALISMLAR